MNKLLRKILFVVIVLVILAIVAFWLYFAVTVPIP